MDRHKFLEQVEEVERIVWDSLSNLEFNEVFVAMQRRTQLLQLIPKCTPELDALSVQQLLEGTLTLHMAISERRNEVQRNLDDLRRTAFANLAYAKQVRNYF